MLVSLLVHLGVADEWDPMDNNVGTNATSLFALDETLQSHGPHTLGPTDTNDWSQIPLIAGIPCQFSSSGSLNARGSLYADVNGSSQVASDTQTGDFLFTYLPETSETYYLNVQSWPLGSSDSYTLQYTIPSADAWDPSDNFGTNATMLSMGEAAKIHGPHILDETDHYDWFQCNLSSGIVYRFESTGDDDTKGYLYSSPLSGEEKGDDANDGWEWVSDDDGDDLNFRIDYPCSQDGNYYVLARSFTVGDEVSYDLLYYIPAKDSDGDQLLDSWEIQYFTDLTAEPADPGDTDPFTNLEEYIAGTDPTNAASFFAVTNWSTGSFVVGWPSVAAREYKVLWAESLTNSFLQLGPMVDHPQNSYTDTLHNAEASGFYKVEVRLK